jgi:hypothetical protein
MLLSIHPIWSSASAQPAQHQRRSPQMAGDRAGNQDRQFVGVRVERFRHFSDLFLRTSSPCMAERLVGAVHEFAQLGAGIYPELGERIVQMGFHRVRRDVQPLCH